MKKIKKILNLFILTLLPISTLAASCTKTIKKDENKEEENQKLDNDNIKIDDTTKTQTTSEKTTKENNDSTQTQDTTQAPYTTKSTTSSTDNANELNQPVENSKSNETSREPSKDQSPTNSTQTENKPSVLKEKAIARSFNITSDSGLKRINFVVSLDKPLESGFDLDGEYVLIVNNKEYPVTLSNDHGSNQYSGYAEEFEKGSYNVTYLKHKSGEVIYANTNNKTEGINITV
ncbi:hypothetical protein [Mycoplasma leonicaptivi]|uniref:hypothetical protein n=1 Tax=Mycoplasma leonicaptivi TaxID=36742 RepID=UPI0004806B53|nr:hypothetical protein [Mycoplasma leonicaptivi]